MKKLAAASMIGLALLGFGAGVYAASDIRLLVNGKRIDTDIQIVNGSSYVPLRVVSEALGANVNWDEASRTISIKKTKSFNVNAVVWSGSARMKISSITLDTAFQNDKTAAPINAIIFDVSIDTTGSGLQWYPTQGKIKINQEKIVEISKPNQYSDDLDGKISMNEVKKGKIVVEVGGNLDDIKTVEFMIDGSTNGHTFNMVEQMPIDLK